VLYSTSYLEYVLLTKQNKLKLLVSSTMRIGEQSW